MPAGVHDASMTPKAKVDDIILRLASGMGQMATADATHSSRSTVAAVKAQHPEAILGSRDRILTSLTIAGEGMAQRLATEFADIPIGQLPIACAVVIDKILLLSGEATSRIDHTSSQDGVLTLRDELSQIPEAQVLECETVTTPLSPASEQALKEAGS